MEPWFDGGLVGSIIGGAIGVSGALLGCAGSFLVSRAKCKKLVMGYLIGITVASFLLLAAGLVALLVDQPKSVWYALIHPGIIGTVLFGAFIPVILKRYRTAELQIMAAHDL